MLEDTHWTRNASPNEPLPRGLTRRHSTEQHVKLDDDICFGEREINAKKKKNRMNILRTDRDIKNVKYWIMMLTGIGFLHQTHHLLIMLTLDLICCSHLYDVTG